MQLLDTHCHIHEVQSALSGDDATRTLWLCTKQLDPDDIIARANANGITKLICVGTSVDDSKLAVDFVQSRSKCWASVGVHPHEALSDMEKLAELKTLTKKPKAIKSKIVAIGECGLDYFYNHSPKEAQIAALKFQLELALECDLPVIFHVREAFADFWPVFDSYTGIRGVLHSFTDTAENLQKALKRGLYIGVNGIITFTKHEWQLENVKTIPADRILLETDAPFLTPVPHRGKVNEPAHLGYVAEFVAKLRGEVLDQLADATTLNAQQLFAI